MFSLFIFQFLLGSEPKAESLMWVVKDWNGIFFERVKKQGDLLNY